MKDVYLRNSGLSRVVTFLAILLLVVLGISVFLLTRLRANRGGLDARDPVAIHLVDEFKPENVEGTPQETATTPSRAEWRFDGSIPSPSGEKNSATLGWQAGPGVADLQVREGRLVGRSVSDCPIIYAERTVGLDDPDTLHAAEIRMCVSAGANLSITGSDSEKLNLEGIVGRVRRGAVLATTPIVADNQMKTYIIEGNQIEGIEGNRIRHVLIRPTDANEATFEIESVRLVFHREYLASIPSGPGWQGLSKIYRQTLISKTPEVIQFPLTLPDRPWLDLALGIVDDGPMTFQVKVRSADQSAEDVAVLSRTITTPHRWEPVQVDLSQYARQNVILSLSLAAQKVGTLGFWGSPVIRNSGAIARPVKSEKDAFSREIPQGVILIWADMLRWDHLDVYGYSRQTAPVLKQMAEEGTLFHDCLSQGPWTLLSTVSLLTSLYPTTHGVTDMYDHYLPASATTLAEVFHDAGYATLSFVSMHYAGGQYNLDQGFEELHEQDSAPEARKNSGGGTAREYVSRLLDWLEEHREVPFFVFLHTFEPKGKPYPPYDTLWADPSAKERHEKYIEKVGYFATREKIEKAGIDLDDLITVRKDLYDSMIRIVDTEIGRFFERLKELGLDEKTLVILMSDHGEEFFEHGEFGHGPWLSFPMYSEVTHVPLIVRWPGVIPEGAEVYETVRTIDLMPTILELCHLPVPEAVQGQSLLPLFAKARRTSDESVAMSERNATLPTRQWRKEPAVCEEPASERQKRLRSEKWKKASLKERELWRENYLKNGDYAIILDGWKLHVCEPLEGDPEYELYDHRKDPLDEVNLADKHPEIVERLAEEFKAWKEKATAARLAPDSELEKKLDSEDLKRLRSLGYLR
jgi:arylsulfatase A-like enzyme